MACGASDKASATERFRAEDAARRADLAFAASFHSGDDLKRLKEAELPLEARALPAALADFRADMPGTLEMLGELSDGDPTLANLYMRAIVEEVPMTMLGEVLQPGMFEKLRELESFREYEAKVEARAKAKAEAEVKVEAKVEADARVAEATTRVAEATTRVAEATTRAAEAEARVAEAEAAAEIKATAGNLKDFLVLRGDAPSEHALNQIRACRNADVLAAWLKRAYLGETSAQLFPEPKRSAG
jgi:hypothetical protein